MRIVSFSTPGTDPRPGFLIGTDVVASEAVLGPGSPGSIPELLAQRDEARWKAARALRAVGVPRIPVTEVQLHAPVRRGALILCVGGNYRSHLEEMGEPVPDQAPSFLKNPNAVADPGHPIVLPSEFPEMVDFEGELAVVFGRPCHRVRSHEAMNFVAGYTILNDVSDRHLMDAMLAAATPAEGRWSVIQMLMGKQLPTFAPVGPAILTADEVPDPAALRLTTRVNGEVMQDASVAGLVVGIPQLIEEMSRYYSFAPGDLMSTGTPAGTGAAQHPPRYLKAGDHVAIEVTGIGELANPVAHEPSPPGLAVDAARRDA